MNAPPARIEFVDVAKGIAIFCVMLSHFFYCGLLHKLLFAFEIPLFFFLSGFFLSRTKPIAEVVRRRFLQLIVPFILVTAFVAGARTYLTHADDVCSVFLTAFSGHYNFRTGVGPYWFLPALFFSSAISAVLIRTRRGFLYSLCLFLAGSWVIPRVYVPWNVALACACVVYVYLGAYCRHNGILDRPFANDRVYLAAFAAFWLYGAGAYDITLSVPTSPDLLLVALSAILVVCKVSRWIVRFRMISAIWQWLGRHSLLILTFHTLDLVLSLPTHWPLYGAFGMPGRLAVPILLTYGGLKVTEWGRQWRLRRG